MGAGFRTAGPFFHAGSLTPTFAFCAAHSRPGFCFPGEEGGSSPYRPPSSPQGSLSLLGELEATEKNKGNPRKKAKEGVRCLLDGKPTKGGSNRRLQEGWGMHTPSSSFSPGGESCPEQDGKSLEGQPAVQGHPGDVGAEGLRSLRQPVWVHLRTVCSCRRQNPLLPIPSLFLSPHSTEKQ